MEKIMIKKEAGEVSVIPYDEQELKNAKEEGHLCWGKGNYVCSNACPNGCAKINDIEKKTLDKYDFIDGGVQTLDKNGKTDVLFVTSCKNFVKKVNKASVEGISAISARRELRDYYLDALAALDARYNISTDIPKIR